jgi:hypothetical protein
MPWFKGNTHTHTLNSDGDSTPSEVAGWYRDHGYDFLVLSDHNVYAPLVDLQEEMDRGPGRLLLIPGEEVSDVFDDGERVRPLHVNATNSTRLVGPQGGASVAEVLRRLISGVEAAGGMAAVNHPNFRWAIGLDDLMELDNIQHLEVYNGHPQVNHLGGGGRPGNEEMWDALLTAGRRVLGLGVDDAHSFKTWGPEFSNPGRGWIVVDAEGLTADAIVGGLRKGAFYISTGVELLGVEALGGRLALSIGAQGDLAFTTEFIGGGGRLIDIQRTMTPALELPAGEPYLRARVRSSSGSIAWTQPIFP